MPLITFLVEDSKVIRDSLIPTLEDLANARVIGTAESQDDAVEWLADHDGKWDLAVVDLFLKQGSGLGVLAALKRRHPHQRMVVLSNYATDEMRAQCLAQGADAVFDKSNEIEALLDYCSGAGYRARP